MIMTWQDMREAFMRTLGLFRRKELDRDLQDELSLHLALKVSSGQSLGQAKHEFGGIEKWKEACRDVRRWRFLDECARDLAFAVRILRKSPIFTGVAVSTLTLAIGANTAVFTLMHDLVLKSLPISDPNRLAILRIQQDKRGYQFSSPLFALLEQNSRPVMNLFAWSDRVLTLDTRDGIEAVSGQFVSGEYFRALGVHAQVGRLIRHQDDVPGPRNGLVAVVTDDFSRTRMGGARQALGRTLQLNQSLFTVIGVLPEGFRGMSRDHASQIFVPLQSEPLVDAPFNLVAMGYRAFWISVGGSLQPGVSLEQANAFLTANSQNLLAAVPPTVSLPGGPKLTDCRVIAEPGATGFSLFRIRFRKPLTLLMELVATVLLIACLNLATLFAARGAAREHEISTRFALGASRSRVLRQLLTESFVLACAGAVLALTAAPALAHIVAVTLVPQHVPDFAPLQVRPDLSIFAFTACIGVAATILAGALPALQSTSGKLAITIKEGSQSIRAGERRYGWPKWALVVEMALSLGLVTAATLLGYSLLKLRTTPLGFEPNGLVVLTPQGRQPILGPHILLGYKQAAKEIEALPGVQYVSLSVAVPFSSGYLDDQVQREGGRKYHFQENAVGPEYFKTLRISLLEGREFRWSDLGRSTRKVILNSSAARLLFPDGRIIGGRLMLNGNTTAEVVGLVADSKYTDLRQVDPPMLYSPATQGVMPGASLSILLRVRHPTTALITAARMISKHVIPDIPAPAAMSMEEIIAGSLATERVMTTLGLFFGGLSLLITAIGLYGAVAYMTQRRTSEIGVRLTLGARRTDILTMVCAENAWITVLGCLAGAVGSVWVSKTISSLVYGVSIHDPAVLITALATLLFVAGLASLIPSLRAANMSPLAAIRYE
jgi:predicted permease